MLVHTKPHVVALKHEREYDWDDEYDYFVECDDCGHYHHPSEDCYDEFIEDYLERNHRVLTKDARISTRSYEWDAFSPARHHYRWKAGDLKTIKRKYNRRMRRQVKEHLCAVTKFNHYDY